MTDLSGALWPLLNGLESVAFVSAVLLAVLALAWGKAGLKQWKRQQENRCWRAAAAAALLKFGLMAVTVTWNLIAYFKR
ncbi:MAG TPA: hypothetical protein VNZ54_07080 [bacterium]|jgi:hypothetical protein|nr:hypothetical protein [bacterium]